MFTRKISYNPVINGAELLQNCRMQINSAKEKISCIITRDGPQKWGQSTSNMELSKHVANALRGRHGIPVNASNAFFKCIELFNLIGPFLRKTVSSGTIHMFDNASLPGDFIRAAEWWITNRSGVTNSKLDWRANSLINGLDDRFGLQRDYPDRWMTSLADINGDVASSYNRASIKTALGDWRADIYTSDLGFGVQDYFKEEEEHLDAHLGQCILGMDILKKGGVLIVKTFTMSHVKTIEMICRLMKNFDEFYIVKPETSKPDNSECYWLCMGYHGESLVDEMSDYSQDVVSAQTELANLQSKKINQNISDYKLGYGFGHYKSKFANSVQSWCMRHTC